MKNGAKVIRSSCRGCHGVCQVLVSVDENGKVAAIKGDKESPTSRGYICPKGARAADIAYHPDRILHPMLRAGDRGQGKWQKISWDEATDLIADKFRSIMSESGAEHIAIAQGTGRPYTEFTGRFCNALGSPNFVGPAHNCFVPRNICAEITQGWFPQPDIYGRGGEKPRCMMVLGSNIMETGGADGYCGGMVTGALRDAEKTIVIDPRATSAAKKSDLHLRLRPGTECALLLAMLHTIIKEEAYDAEFVERYCSGFEALRQHIAAFTSAWAEGVTRVPEGLIREGR